MYDLRWEYVFNNKDLFIDGLLLGLKMAVVSLLIGCAIGLVLAFLRSSGKRWLTIPITIYVEVLRNIPLLLIVFLLYFGLPQAFPRHSAAHDYVLRLLPDNIRTFEIALAIYAGAYLTEIFSAGISSVGERYLDAGKSLGLNRFQIAWSITLPIMFRSVLPSLSNTLISLFKDTSIAVAIATPELTMAAREISTNYFRVIEAWTAAGVLYLATSYAIAVSLRWLERRIKWSV